MLSFTKLASELVATSLLKRRKVVADDVPKHVVSDAMIFVAQDIADACYFRPRNCRMACLEIVAKMSACFGNDLDAALDQSALALFRFERRKRDPGHFGLNQLDRFNDVSQARRGGALNHQNTWSAEASMRCFKRG